MATATELQTTPFHQFHIDHGGKLVDYSGWSMPLHYGSIIDEHRQVRSSGGLFDVSHMGRLRFKGRDAVAFLDRLVTRNVVDMAPGQVRYGIVCNEQGGCRDDVLVYRVDEAECLMVCNAANRIKIIDHVGACKGTSVFKMTDETTTTAMVAVQGPNVMDLIGRFSRSIPDLKRYRFQTKQVLIAKFLISRTGYTGEDGIEAILPRALASKAVKMMLGNLEEGQSVVKPCGLGARDSLRLEAGMALYGHEIDEHTDPLSAGLDFAVSLDKPGGFIGQEALQKIQEAGPKTTLRGLLLEGRRAARQGMSVQAGSSVVGTITSGCLSPSLDASIAMAHMQMDHAQVGTQVEVDLGRSTTPAVVCKLPFDYRSSS
ncbi:MAG: glycine cleavage system aminomethyltransferase GcvT [Phycisphaerales bacterium]|nr:glycine cleavage system aminomethyltransferase GcvT [Phycisphaerales bacterium]